MATRAAWRLGGLLLVLGLAGCQTVDEFLRGRELIIPVLNNTNFPATVMVGVELAPGVHRSVGTANPATLSPNTSEEVRFGVPAGSEWSIYVITGPKIEPVVTAADIPPGAAGAMPFEINIDRTGVRALPNVRGEMPGWFGD